MRYLRREVQAREQAVSVTKLATSLASIKIPPGAASLWSVTASPPHSEVFGRVILFRCGETFARKLVIVRTNQGDPKMVTQAYDSKR
jgi:hypothetical protein